MREAAGSPAQMAEFFQALSDRTRLRLLNLLGQGEVCVCDLTDTLKMVQPKISRHLAQLRRAGLVQARREGKWIYYRSAKTGDSFPGHVLAAVRKSMSRQDPFLNERDRLRKVCCAKKRRKKEGIHHHDDK